ncbi:MAG TPA: C25 family cysteine peptidase [Lacipirellulaceae bacterium]|nr:C25 family cysteine peptidase [Lacipirellulaceae bacterium]
MVEATTIRKFLPTHLLTTQNLYAALVILLLEVSAHAPAPDTLVVCPREFRPALTQWETFRRAQGHQISVIDAPSAAAQVQTKIREVARSGKLKYVLLIGDVPGYVNRATAGGPAVPTNYLQAKINIRWGSTSTIASDGPYGDLDGDGLPELAVGRIPADSPAELAAAVRKIIHYEKQVANEECCRRINIVAGIGGFGAVTDALIESTAHHVIRQTVPRNYDIQPTLANPSSPHCPKPGEFASTVRRQFSAGSLAWIYLGHGLPAELDRVPAPGGTESILSVDDVPLLRRGEQAPLAVLVACYTGAIDAKSDCLGEELLLAEEGPIAVIAATRVTMPYGNTVLGYELLRACFNDRPDSLGEILRLAQRRSLSEPDKGSLRASIDSLAKDLTPAPVDLPAERREHVLMYQLLGDPLLRLHRPAEPPATSPAQRETAK